LTYGPDFFTLAAGLTGADVTIGLNRQLNNQANSLQAAVQAKSAMSNLYAIEIGNEPDCAYLGSKVDAFELKIGKCTRPARQLPQPGRGIQRSTVRAKRRGRLRWRRRCVPFARGVAIANTASQTGDIFQAGVYLSNSWSISGLISNLGSAIAHTKTFSRHSYPQSACNGASTNLPALMGHAFVAVMIVLDALDI
jgi:hypothetical protein